MKQRVLAVSLALCLAALVVLAAAGCSSGGSTSGTTGGGYGTPPASSSSGATTSGGGGGTTVVEQNFAFSPSTLTVKVGDTVTFSNQDSVTHNVLINSQNLGPQSPGSSVTWTASKAGSFPYSCTIHPTMTGEIVVQ